jgi:hypothetical protein
MTAMAGLGGRYADFDGLLDSDQPKDTEVTIAEEYQEEGNPAAGELEHAGGKRSRQDTPDNHTTLGAHWVVLRSLSPYFRAKVSRSSCLTSAAPTSYPKEQHQQPANTRPTPPPDGGALPAVAA